MHAFQAVILGLIEGITEFLPISSTGHLIIGSHFLRVENADFAKSFEVFIQLGAILAIVALYFKKLFLNAKVFWRVAVGFLPTAIIGLVLYKFVKAYLLGNLSVVLWSLFLGGIALIAFEYWNKKKEEVASVASIESISYKQAVLIGLAQSVAIVPGVSRAAATIVGGLALGISRATIVEYSFLLAVPTMAAATGLDLLKSAHSFTGQEIGMLAIGFVVSFLSALIAVRFLLKYVKSHTFVPFGVYRIVAAIAFAVILIY